MKAWIRIYLSLGPWGPGVEGAKKGAEGEPMWLVTAGEAEILGG